MGAYLVRRLLQVPVVLLVLATVTFVIVRLAPSGPFAGERALDPTVQKALEERFALDRPLPVQYGRFLADLARGDLGPSMSTYKGRTVNEVLADRLPTSLLLGALALLAALAIGIPVGVLSALRPRSPLDRGTMVLAVLAISVPSFVVAPLLALAFGLWLNVLPTSGYHGWMQPQYLVLPVLALALPFAGRIARLTRAGLLEVLALDFVRSARAKGATEWRIASRHALRLGFVPVASFLGPATAYVLTGSLVIEQVFQLPGLGREFVVSATNRDYTLVMGTVLVYGAILVASNLVADLLIGWLDPRVRQP